MQRIGLYCLFSLLGLLISCGDPNGILEERKLNNGVIQLVFDSKALKSNLLEDQTRKKIHVLLPPSYNQSQKRFPVIYYLHGYEGDSLEFLLFLDALEKTAAAGREFIFVGVDGRNKFHGSFYVNSSVTGAWEDYITDEIVPLIDGKYRTIATSGSRAICGHSMGGFGALYLGFRHPDMFSVVYSLSPGLFDPDGLENALIFWNGIYGARGAIFPAYGTAFAPDSSKAPYYFMVDSDTLNKPDEIAQKWENGFGNLPEKIAGYLANPTRLKALRIDYGLSDIGWIVDGCVYFSGLLEKNKIPHEITAFTGDHTLRSRIIMENMLPFLLDNLEQ